MFGVLYIIQTDRNEQYAQLKIQILQGSVATDCRRDCRLFQLLQWLIFQLLKGKNY